SSSTSLLHQLKEQGGIDIICVLLLAIQQTQPEYKVLAASLLLQLDVLEESVDNILNREVAIKTLLESLTCEENPDAQQLAAFILSNLGGTYAWSGESYTIAWLVKKTGLNSMLHKNIVKNIDWLDDTLQQAYEHVGMWNRSLVRKGCTRHHKAWRSCFLCFGEGIEEQEQEGIEILSHNNCMDWM
ncbi:transducin/WD40 repeat-like superfamily protein, partial [Tanacetum coccineum]